MKGTDVLQRGAAYAVASTDHEPVRLSVRYRWITSRLRLVTPKQTEGELSIRELHVVRPRRVEPQFLRLSLHAMQPARGATRRRATESRPAPRKGRPAKGQERSYGRAVPSSTRGSTVLSLPTSQPASCWPA